VFLAGRKAVCPPPCKEHNVYTYTHTTSCHIAIGYNENNYHLSTYNFSKEQCTLPEDDLRIETCKSFLNVLL
jgi:hypothetical protein